MKVHVLYEDGSPSGGMSDGTEIIGVFTDESIPQSFIKEMNYWRYTVAELTLDDKTVLDELLEDRRKSRAWTQAFNKEKDND